PPLVPQLRHIQEGLVSPVRGPAAHRRSRPLPGGPDRAVRRLRAARPRWSCAHGGDDPAPAPPVDRGGLRGGRAPHPTLGARLRPPPGRHRRGADPVVPHRTGVAWVRPTLRLIPWWGLALPSAATALAGLLVRAAGEGVPQQVGVAALAAMAAAAPQVLEDPAHDLLSPV